VLPRELILALRVFARPCPSQRGTRGRSFLDSRSLPRRRTGRLMRWGWDTAHTSATRLGGLGGLERSAAPGPHADRIAPAGGWSRYTPVQFEIVAQFLAGMPLWLRHLSLGERVYLRLPASRKLSYLRLRASRRPQRRDLIYIITTHACPAYLPAAAEIATCGPAGSPGPRRRLTSSLRKYRCCRIRGSPSTSPRT